ncbi:MAG TPA: type II secretion system F family protein [Polyangia bacterium]|jgi:tight adherence protein B
MRQLVFVVLAVGAAAALEAIYHVVRYLGERRREELRRRLGALGTAQEADARLLRRGRLSDNPAVDRILRGFPAARRLERLLEQADVRFSVARLLGYAVAGALAAGVAGALARLGPATLLLAALGGAAPFLVVLGLRDRRSRKLSEQLPDALAMMARSLRAGHALPSSFKLVASEMAEPINLEFGRAFEEQNLGLSFEQAVLGMTVRAPQNRDLKIFAVSVIVQKETGGNLVEILENIAETVRARYRFYGKLRALTAEGRVSGVVLGLLPIAVGVVLALFNPDYLATLVTTIPGRLLLLYGTVSWLAGFVWMRVLAKVEP